MDTPNSEGVYLLHFDRPIAEGHTTQHYLGYASNIAARLQVHRAAPNARLLQVARDRGIGFQLARLWVGADRSTERRLKNRANAPQLCPICHPATAPRQAVNPLAGRGRKPAPPAL